MSYQTEKYADALYEAGYQGTVTATSIRNNKTISEADIYIILDAIYDATTSPGMHKLNLAIECAMDEISMPTRPYVEDTCEAEKRNYFERNCL